MESTGIKGFIHISEATKEALEVSGKGSWISPRGDTVAVKGKGEMTTYFVEPTSNTASNSSSPKTDDTIPSIFT